MKWVKFKIKTITEAEDIIISTLYDIGLEGAQIEDKVPLTALEKEQMFVDILPDVPEDDGVAYLSFFVEEKEVKDLQKVQEIFEKEEFEKEGFTKEGFVKKEFEKKGLGREEFAKEGFVKEEFTKESEGKTGRYLEIQGEYVDRNTVCTRIKEQLEELRQWMDIGEGGITIEETEDIDWINNWKQYFHQFYIDDILVIPSWEEVKIEDTNKMILHIDPGTAFGTGMHETTQLCIRQLRKYITSETELLDVGTGSGILAILSLMFGAKHTVGTDLDPCAEEAAAQNCRANHIPETKFERIIGNIITEKEIQDRVGYECYDIVVANILADVLVMLTPVIVKQLKKGGIYITSGIIDDKEETVVQAVKEAGFEVLEVTYQGEWVSVTAQKK